jgi:hypothetical protein
MDWAVWRHVVDTVIRRPDFIEEQVQLRREELRAQDDTSLSEIARGESRLQEIEGERAFYQRHAARGRITQAEFDKRMEETDEAQRYWQDEMVRLKELRDDSAKVKSSLDYAKALLETLQKRLDELDQPPDELKKMPEEEQALILESRRQIIRALCDRVTLYRDGRVVIEGVIDGSEGVQFSALGC